MVVSAIGSSIVCIVDARFDLLAANHVIDSQGRVVECRFFVWVTPLVPHA